MAVCDLTSGGELLLEEDQIDILKADSVEGPGLQKLLNKAGWSRREPCPARGLGGGDGRRLGGAHHQAGAVADTPQVMDCATQRNHVTRLQKLLNIYIISDQRYFLIPVL